MMEDAGPSLYERLGGAAGVTSVVDDLYRRVLADPELAPFFHDSAVDDVRRHQRELVTAALGGPSSYTGRSLREAHAGLDIAERHVELVLGHLEAALDHCGAAHADLAPVLAVVTRLWRAQWWPSET